MPGTFAVNTEATFTACVLISSGPKAKFGAADQQETNAQGMPKWLVEVAVTFTPGVPGMKPVSELVSVTITAPVNPADGFAVGTAITFQDFRVGLNAAERGENGRIRGGKLWYNAAAIRPAMVSQRPKSDAA